MDQRGFRALLVLGAVECTAIGIWGIVWAQMLTSVLGLKVPEESFGMARIFGAAMLALAIAYALAAAQPHRNRGLLVPLFILPLAIGVVMIASIAQGDVEHTFRAVVFTVLNFAFGLLYFRTYPRVDIPEAPPAAPEPPST
jgi:hypothetical protein